MFRIESTQKPDRLPLRDRVPTMQGITQFALYAAGVTVGTFLGLKNGKIVNKIEGSISANSTDSSSI